LRGFYKKEFNMHNPLDLQGSVAETFKLLLDDVHSHTETWAPRKDQSGRVTHSVEPSKFKRVIAQLNGGMFDGYQQHDSQELLSVVLDGIHEDCNRVKSKLFVENVVGDGTNDTDIAREAWDRCKMRNDSFVVDTFQGQLRSRVTCAECHNMSVSFDPSMYLGLSIKQVVQHFPIFSRRSHLSVFFFCRF
jgi:ubiquitin C-terminal hydrolase